MVFVEIEGVSAIALQVFRFRVCYCCVSANQPFSRIDKDDNAALNLPPKRP